MLLYYYACCTNYLESSLNPSHIKYNMLINIRAHSAIPYSVTTAVSPFPSYFTAMLPSIYWSNMHSPPISRPPAMPFATNIICTMYLKFLLVADSDSSMFCDIDVISYFDFNESYTTYSTFWCRILLTTSRANGAKLVN